MISVNRRARRHPRSRPLPSSIESLEPRFLLAVALVDPGFETPDVGSGDYFDFAYTPIGSPWTFTGGGGVAGNGSGFTVGTPDAPEGDQVLFLQALGTASQTITVLEPMSCVLSFQAAQRGNYQQSYQEFNVLLDGVPLETFRPPGTAYVTLSIGPFALGTGVHTIGFESTNPNGGDNTAFIDAVALTTPETPSQGDGGFESPEAGPAGEYGSYVYGPVGTGWAYQGGVGVTANGSGFTSGNPDAPEGDQVLFIQGGGSATSVYSLTAGSYHLSFQAAQRGNYSNGPQSFVVLVDGASLGTFTPAGAGYEQIVTPSFTVDDGNHTVTIRGLTDPVTQGDRTAFIDVVAIRSDTAEPPPPPPVDPGNPPPSSPPSNPGNFPDTDQLPTPLRIVNVSTAAEYVTALTTALPGDEIRIDPGEYAGDIQVANMHGTIDHPIVVTAADPLNKPVIGRGANEGLKLSDAWFVMLVDLTFHAVGSNGINIDDGGTFDTPSHDISLIRVDVRVSGDNGIKLAGVDSFQIVDGWIFDWGSGGSGIDMVGCHDGLIARNLFQDARFDAHDGVQAKGGSDRIRITENRFEEAGTRAIQIGGATGTPFFRPPGSPEATNIQADHNVIEGSETAISFASSTGGLFDHNTVVGSSPWAVRILNEDPLFPPTGGVISNNLFLFGTAESWQPVNVGFNTDPSTFRFDSNWWYNLIDPSLSTPVLPVAETSGVYGVDPQVIDVTTGNYHLQPGSRAVGYGAF